MADMQQFLHLNSNQAALVRGYSSDGAALDPRTIAAGPNAGDAVLPLAVLEDPAHVSKRLFLLSLDRINVDADVCWPQSDS